jgi:hypothetical protein
MKGYKRIAYAALENARMKNTDKDKLGGKEWKPGWDKSPEFRRASPENLLNVLPILTEGRSVKRPITAPISDKKRQRVERFLFGA